MPGEQFIPLLKELTAFYELVDSEVATVAAAGQSVVLDEQETLTVPDDQHAPFYMILSGRIALSIPVSRPKRVEKVLKTGEFFGADFLLTNKLFSQTATALTPVSLLQIPSPVLERLLSEIPPFRRGLMTVFQISRLLRSKHFSWIGEDEVVKLVVRKHPAYLLVSLIAPVLIGWVAVLFFAFAMSALTASALLALDWLGVLVLLGAVFFGIWRWIDWGNDYYLITDQRVVWLEQVIGLYDSRQESPLTAIKSSQVRTSFLGRILGYGDLVALAFMGQVVFRHIGQPAQVKVLLDHSQQLANVRMIKADTEAMERVIRRKIEPITTSSGQSQQSGGPANGGSSFWVRFANYFKTRFEIGDVITYRKHVFILITKTWLPALIGLFLLALAILVIRENMVKAIQGAIVWISLFVIFIGLLAVFLWWLYQYIDWRNDIYQITSDKIIDTMKKPLGDEVTKSAPLENIQSLDYERHGILGILLNFGDVIINVGTEAKLDFYGVHDPARAQQDIFNRMYNSRRNRQLVEAAKQWEQVSDWLAAYHRQAEDLRKTQNQPEADQNSDKI